MNLLKKQKNALVQKKCIELIPIMYDNIKSVFKDEKLKTAF